MIVITIDLQAQNDDLENINIIQNLFHINWITRQKMIKSFFLYNDLNIFILVKSKKPIVLYGIILKYNGRKLFSHYVLSIVTDYGI